MLNYPFSAIVGQNQLKRCLLLNLICPQIGGVLIQGEKGTAKTTAVRALAKLSDSCSVVELPLGVSEDRLIGSINLKKVLSEGEKEFEPGILKEADGNILYVDEVNLLGDNIVDLILDAAATGANRVERDGISYSHPSRFVLVGTMNPEEGSLRPQLLDRFGLSISIKSDLSLDERTELVKRRLSFERDSEGFCRHWAYAEKELALRIKTAKESIGSVRVSGESFALCSEICRDMQVDGYRADITIIKTAAAIAALDGLEEAGADQITEAAGYALAHRIKRQPFENREFKSENISEARKKAEKRQEEAEASDDRPSPDDSQGNSDGRLSFSYCAEIGKCESTPKLQDGLNEKGLSGRRVKRRAVKSGGHCEGSASYPVSDKIHITESIKAGILADGSAAENLRWQRLYKKGGSLIVFLVDASGSMLARRGMEFAKGCVFNILQEAYIKRDQVALISFGGEEAELLLPPTESKELAFNLLSDIKTGGRTPMLDAFKKAAVLIEKYKNMPVELVLVTDGKYSSMGEKNPEALIKTFGELLTQRNIPISVALSGGAREKAFGKRLASLLGTDNLCEI